jgi:hypothetical protein
MINLSEMRGGPISAGCSDAVYLCRFLHRQLHHDTTLMVLKSGTSRSTSVVVSEFTRLLLDAPRSVYSAPGC